VSDDQCAFLAKRGQKGRIERRADGLMSHPDRLADLPFKLRELWLPFGRFHVGE
jgi:hypothetical protein